jgi:hypothetical protein
MDLYIDRVDNGYSIRYDYEGKTTKVIVFEEKKEDDKEALAKALIFIREYFEIYNSNEDPEELRIEVIKHGK